MWDSTVNSTTNKMVFILWISPSFGGEKVNLQWTKVEGRIYSISHVNFPSSVQLKIISTISKFPRHDSSQLTWHWVLKKSCGAVGENGRRGYYGQSLRSEGSLRNRSGSSDFVFIQTGTCSFFNSVNLSSLCSIEDIEPLKFT